MSPTSALDAIRQFSVPPTREGQPPRGWPDGVDVPPDPVRTTLSTSADATSLSVVAALTPGAHVGGYADAPPYWQGARVLAHTTSGLTVDVGPSHPNGVETLTLAATSAGQTLFALGFALAEVLAVQRLSDAALVAVNAGVGGHNLATGAVGVGAATPAIAVDDQLEFTFRRAPIAAPAGTAVTITRPRTAPAAASVTTGEAWSDAYRALFEAGAAAGVPPLSPALEPAREAMRTVIDGMMSVPGLAPAALQAGVTAWWGIVAASAATIWPGSVAATPPPGIATLALQLAPGAPTTLALMACAPTDPWTPAPAEQAAAILATLLYAVSQGATVIYPGPAAVPFL